MNTFRRIAEDRFACVIFDEPFTLARSDAGWTLQNESSGGPITLDQLEAEAAFALGQAPNHMSRLEIQGLALDEAPMGEAIAVLKAEATPNSVLLDTTTLASAQFALESPDPISLLDLSVATFGFVAFETVLVQPHGGYLRADLAAHLADGLRELSYDRQLISGPLWSVCAELMNSLNDIESGQNRSLTKAWSNFFGRDDIRLDAHRVGLDQDSPLYWDGVPASYFMYKKLSLEAGRPGELNEFLSVQTIRALYNDILAGALGVPYLSTSLRAPVYAELLTRKLETQLLADKLLAGLGPPASQSVEPGPYIAELSAPFLLGVVLSRIKQPGEYWSALGELRQSFAPLRKRIDEDRDQWEGRSNPYIANYLRHVSGYVPDGVEIAGKTLTAAATAAASVATASPLGGALAKLAIKIVSSCKPAAHAYQWYLRRFRPDVNIVVELAEEAAKLRSIETEISRLWKAKWDRSQHDVLEKLSLVRPDAYSKLRQLG